MINFWKTWGFSPFWHQFWAKNTPPPKKKTKTKQKKKQNKQTKLVISRQNIGFHKKCSSKCWSAVDFLWNGLQDYYFWQNSNFVQFCSLCDPKSLKIGVFPVWIFGLLTKIACLGNNKSKKKYWKMLNKICTKWHSACANPPDYKFFLTKQNRKSELKNKS